MFWIVVIGGAVDNLHPILMPMMFGHGLKDAEVETQKRGSVYFASSGRMVGTQRKCFNIMLASKGKVLSHAVQLTLE